MTDCFQRRACRKIRRASERVRERIQRRALADDCVVSTVPIPGGCNMEFEIEIAPYQKLRVENKMIVVDAQPAAAPAVNDSPISCEKDPVQHTMYRLHLPMYDFAPKTYFDTIASMLTVRDIVRNGTEVSYSLYYRIL